MSIIRSKILEVHILPVSGGGFPAQLQELIYYMAQAQLATETSEQSGNYMEYTPDICLSASGGNVATYISLSGNWSEGGIKRVIQNLNPRMFSNTWWPGPLGVLPAWILGIFEGSIFKPGYGPSRLFKSFSDSRTIQDVEIWSGTYNQSQKRSTFFCNKTEGQTFISPITYNPFTFKTTELKFMEGDIDLISKVVIASASIPLLFQPVKILGDEYIDGGTTYTSPLTPMQDEIYNIMTGVVAPSPADLATTPFPLPTPTPEEEQALQDKRSDRDYLHMIYFSPYNIDNTTEKVTSALGSDTFLSASSDASAVKDRYTGINLLQRLKGTSDIVYTDSKIEGGIENLYTLLSAHRGTHYFCEIYVRKNEWVNLITFVPNDILEKMNESQEQIEFKFWYVNPFPG